MSVKELAMKKAEFDDNKSRYVMPRLYEHISRPDLWAQAQQKENARLIPLIKELADAIESIPCNETFHRLGGIDDCDPCLMRFRLKQQLEEL